jgi:hypothetical protein
LNVQANSLLKCSISTGQNIENATPRSGISIINIRIAQKSRPKSKHNHIRKDKRRSGQRRYDNSAHNNGNSLDRAILGEISGLSARLHAGRKNAKSQAP